MVYATHPDTDTQTAFDQLIRILVHGFMRSVCHYFSQIADIRQHRGWRKNAALQLL